MGDKAKILTLLLLVLLVTATPSYAASTTVSVSATILSKSLCKFNAKSANLAFGDLDPLTAPDVTTSTTIDFVCNGSADTATYLMEDDDGLHETGVDASRMQHVTLPAQYIPYTFSLTPTTDTVPKGATQTLTVSGTILGNDYRTAFVGDYTDVITITLTP